MIVVSGLNVQSGAKGFERGARYEGFRKQSQRLFRRLFLRRDRSREKATSRWKLHKAEATLMFINLSYSI